MEIFPHPECIFFFNPICSVQGFLTVIICRFQQIFRIILCMFLISKRFGFICWIWGSFYGVFFRTYFLNCLFFVFFSHFFFNFCSFIYYENANFMLNIPFNSNHETQKDKRCKKVWALQMKIATCYPYYHGQYLPNGMNFE